MITGDNALTACQVAKDLSMIKRPVLILTENESTKSVFWNSIDEETSKDFSSDFEKLSKEFDFCLTGTTLSAFHLDFGVPPPADMPFADTSH